MKVCDRKICFDWINIRISHIYVVDCGNHRVMRWYKDVREGAQSNQFHYSKGLTFDQEGNHRIQKFELE